MKAPQLQGLTYPLLVLTFTSLDVVYSYQSCILVTENILTVVELRMNSGLIGATSNWLDNQTITGMNRAIDINTIPYQNCG